MGSGRGCSSAESWRWQFSGGVRWRMDGGGWWRDRRAGGFDGWDYFRALALGGGAR
jgi:hypothetical protein